MRSIVNRSQKIKLLKCWQGTRWQKLLIALLINEIWVGEWRITIGQPRQQEASNVKLTRWYKNANIHGGKIPTALCACVSATHNSFITKITTNKWISALPSLWGRKKCILREFWEEPGAGESTGNTSIIFYQQ